jgi:hypothetical protein
MPKIVKGVYSSLHPVTVRGILMLSVRLTQDVSSDFFPLGIKETTYFSFRPRLFSCLIVGLICLIIATARRTHDEAPTNKIFPILLLCHFASKYSPQTYSEVRVIRIAILVFVRSKIVHTFQSCRGLNISLILVVTYRN